jgi:hypothetical protein
VKGDNTVSKHERNLGVWEFHHPKDLIVDSNLEKGYHHFDKRTKDELVKYVVDNECQTMHPSKRGVLKPNTKVGAMHLLEIEFSMRVLNLDIPEEDEGWLPLEVLRKRVHEECLARQCHRLGLGRGRDAEMSIHRIRLQAKITAA